MTDVHVNVYESVLFSRGQPHWDSLTGKYFPASFSTKEPLWPIFMFFKDTEFQELT